MPNNDQQVEPQTGPEAQRQPSISGRYAGRSRGNDGAFELDLRLDVDPRGIHSPVLLKVSGDLYQSCAMAAAKGARRWRVFRHSWVVDRARVKWGLAQTRISGTVRFWQGAHPQTEVTITIPRTEQLSPGPAEVRLFENGRPAKAFQCLFLSDCFREVQLEVDVCQSVAGATPLLDFDPFLHAAPPQGFKLRRLSFETAYHEAGIAMQVNPEPGRIDDREQAFGAWSAAELHDAMERHFSQYDGAWPNWHLWGLLGGSFEDPMTAGVMFDAQAAYGGAGRGVERQGFAVFRNHRWFERLPEGPPINAAEAAALRTYLYTWIHEAGHAFNLLHSWDKNQPDALSWMNYPWRYDQRHGEDRFWSEFPMQFDAEELAHLRHADRSAVIMGGDDWGPAHGHGSGDPGLMEGEAPLELKLRARPFFEFMQPVSVELRLRNRLPDHALAADVGLDPELSAVTLYIRRPDGRSAQFAPVLCRVAEPRIATLAPASERDSGADRISAELFLGYGADGFYFDQPGDYVLKAAYQGDCGLLLVSASLGIRIGYPMSAEKERAAQDFFSPEVGLSLYLQGSQSPFLTGGMERLREMIERFQGDALSRGLAERIAPGVGRDFHRVTSGQLQRVYAAAPAEALKLTDQALAFYHQAMTDQELNLPYHKLIQQRMGWHQMINDQAAAENEVKRLQADLGKRGVKRTVLERIGDYLRRF